MEKQSIHWQWIAAAAALALMITMGARQSLGLFVAPLDVSTGLGIATISFAMAIGQFTWGAVQPIAGAVADRYGAGRVIAFGLLVLALGSVFTTFAGSGFGLVVTIGILSAAGSGAASFSVLMGAAARRIPPEKRGIASGFLNGGGSFGQFIFAPILQALITSFGWVSAMYFMAVSALAALPLARTLRTPREMTGAASAMSGSLTGAVKEAFADRSYLLLHAGFFTCGFHIAFLITHLPGEIDLCGLPASVASWSLAIIGLANIVGSVVVGFGTTRYLSKHLLFGMYASRAVFILLYLAAPKTELTFYIFAVGLGLTWLATVSPTAMVVNKLFGTRYLSTLFGLTLLSHQIGGFFGAWLGGLAVVRYGNYDWMWYADVALAAAAALVNLPIREPRGMREATA